MIHPTAQIDTAARIGEGVEIGAFTIVSGNVEIGRDTKIGSHCEIGVPSALSDGSPLRIGANSLIRSHSVFYEGSSFASRLVTGHRVTVREATVGGENLQLGTLSDVQGHCTIGDYVRLHSNVHVGQASVIGNFVWIFPYVVLTNDPHPPSQTMMGAVIEDYAAIATMSVILPGVTIGQGALIGAKSCVASDVAADMIAVGSPAKSVGSTGKIKLTSDPGAQAYPWRRHFHRGYPSEVVARWKAEFPDG